MKTLHLSIIVGSGITISVITGIMIMSGILFITGQNFDNVRSRGLPNLPYFSLFFNGSSGSLSPIQFEARQGQNITLVVNVTSTPENLPMTLYTEPHIGFTTTNGMDLKLSSTHVTTPSTVLLHISIRKDATPNKYRARVFATNMNDTLGTDVGITVKPRNSTEQFSRNSACETEFKPKPFEIKVLPNGTSLTINYVPVFLMKPNSTGKVCINNWSYDKSYDYSGKAIPGTSSMYNSAISYVVITAFPENISVNSVTNTTIVYTITTSKDTPKDFLKYLQCSMIAWVYHLQLVTTLHIHLIMTFHGCGLQFRVHLAEFIQK